jgi:hypothetical protein
MGNILVLLIVFFSLSQNWVLLLGVCSLFIISNISTWFDSPCEAQVHQEAATVINLLLMCSLIHNRPAGPAAPSAPFRCDKGALLGYPPYPTIGARRRIIAINYTVTVTPDTATGRWYLLEFTTREGEANPPRLFARYRDAYRREQGRWKIARMSVDFLWPARSVKGDRGRLATGPKRGIWRDSGGRGSGFCMLSPKYDHS